MDEFPNELWVVCFIRDGRRIYRQFYARGYYNAYDRVLRYAEKRRLSILWFKEKRYCYDIRHDYEQLEEFCVYCNAIFDETFAIECEDCNAILCSKDCYHAHKRFRHKVMNLT